MILIMIMIMIMIGGCILMEMELVSVDLAALHSPTDDSDALIVLAFQVDDTAPRVSLNRFKNVAAQFTHIAGGINWLLLLGDAHHVVSDARSKCFATSFLRPHKQVDLL